MNATLSPRQRVLKALAFEEADIVPYHLMIDEPVRLRLGEYLCDPEFDRRIDNHLPFYNLEPKNEWISPEFYRDAFGSIWKSGIFPHLEQPALKTPSLAGYVFPDILEEDYFAGIPDFFEHHTQHFCLCGIAHGFFDRGWAMRGMENFFEDLVLAPRFAAELFERLADLYIALIDRIAAYPFDGIRFGDDWGHQRGILIGARRWRQLVKPGLKRIFEHARQKGLLVMVHSDGDVSELIPDLIEMGVQILNPLQPEAMNVLEVKRLYGRQMCFNGGISTQLTLPQGTPAEVRQEVAACLRYLGNGGGYVISPAKAIMSDVPLENAAALIDGLINQATGNKSGDDCHSDCTPEHLRRVYTQFHPSPV